MPDRKSANGEREPANAEVERAEASMEPPVDEKFMREALMLARTAAQNGEVPVGAVIAIGGAVVGTGWNRPIATNDPTAHAEMIALQDAAAHLGNYRLEDAAIFVTLEPCAMCAGALVNARVRRLVFGARDLRFGAVRSKFQLCDSGLLNHRIEIAEGVLGAECQKLLQEFFKRRRG